jgi:DNA-binding transcriptional regulator YiaG
MTGEEFKKIRKKLDLTQKETADLLGFASAQTVKNMEGGTVKTSNLVAKVLRYLSSLPTTETKKFIQEFNRYATEKISDNKKEK